MNYLVAGVAILAACLGVFFFLGGGEADNPCILLENEETGELGCFGCAGGLCIDPAPTMKPTGKDPNTYCEPTENGCKFRCQKNQDCPPQNTCHKNQCYKTEVN